MRKVVSLTLGFSFLIMSYTGIMLFLCPHGRVAYWSGWRLLGLSKEQYGDLHTTSMLIFLLFGIWHIYYNWRAILNYLRDKSKKISFTRRELWIALGINLLFIVGTLGMWPPFSTFLSWEESIKEQWASRYGEPPYGHAEESKLKILCKRTGLDLQKSLALLKKRGYEASSDLTLKELGSKYGVSPADLYRIISAPQRPTETIAKDTPARLGRKSLDELCRLKKWPLQRALKYFAERGLTDVTGESRIKNLADELETTPLDLYRSLEKAFSSTDGAPKAPR